MQKGRREGWRLRGIGRLAGFTLDCDPSSVRRPANAQQVGENSGRFTLSGDPDGIKTRPDGNATTLDATLACAVSTAFSVENRPLFRIRFIPFHASSGTSLPARRG